MGKPHQPIEQTRRQLIDAAITVVSHEGIAKATTRRITEVAQLPTGSLHYCFDSKEELVATAYDSATMAGLLEFNRDVQPGVGLHDGIATIVHSAVKWISSGQDIQKAQFELNTWSWRSASYKHLAGRNYRRYIDGVEQMLREVRVAEDPDVDLEVLARIIVGLLDGLVLQWFSLDDNSFKRMAEVGIQQLQAYLLSQRDYAAGLAGVPAESL